MKRNGHNHLCLFLLLMLSAGILFSGCTESSFEAPIKENKHAIAKLDIGLDQLIDLTEFEMMITPRSHGYTAEARGKGTIPAGEYAGHRFQITLEGFYTGIGMSTLESGSTLVKIRGERFHSVMDPFLQSFCCGEGHLLLIDGEWIFSMFGQVLHSTADEPHNHLFAGLARSAGFMNMNIADQTGTIVDPIVPPHDPGIGLIEDFEAKKFEVSEH